MNRQQNFEKTAAGQSLHEKILDALRAELLEYGGLLNCLDQQQGAILKRNAAMVTEIERAITVQVRALRIRRSFRTRLVSTLMANTSAPPTLLRAAALFPPPMRALVEALVREVNQLIGRVRRRVRQNQMLLARTIKGTQDALRSCGKAEGMAIPRDHG